MSKLLSGLSPLSWDGEPTTRQVAELQGRQAELLLESTPSRRHIEERGLTSDNSRNAE